jgi:hypothetical protein
MRRLIPEYFASTLPVGWRCSECDQPFSLAVPERLTATEEIPLAVVVLFNFHKCRIRRSKPPLDRSGAAAD